jgi:hypothetical protein
MEDRPQRRTRQMQTAQRITAIGETDNLQPLTDVRGTANLKQLDPRNRSCFAVPSRLKHLRVLPEKLGIEAECPWTEPEGQRRRWEVV